jgi:hypothetical protein
MHVLSIAKPRLLGLLFVFFQEGLLFFRLLPTVPFYPLSPIGNRRRIRHVGLTNVVS